VIKMKPDQDAPVGDILIVDDNVANLVAIEAALGPLSERVVRAQSGREALALVRQRTFAVILMDVQMPVMDGIEAARFIRAHQPSAHTPIIFMTAYSYDDERVLAAYSLGAVDFLSKPIVTEMLRAKVSVFVELQRRADELNRQSLQLREHERREHERRLQEERRRWDQEAMEAEVAAMAETDRRKDEFLAMLGHELRNPLASVALGLDLIRRRLASTLAASDPVHATQDRVQQQLRHLTRIVDDLLDLSRINSGKIELRRQPTLLSEVIESAVAVSRPLMDQQGHTLEVEAPSEAVSLLADPVRLVQVLTNLMNNAALFTDRGGTIRLTARRADDRLELSVRDNGRGIRPELQPRIFEMFVQEKAAGSGLGLGLTVVKRMVELHGGSVQVRSDGPGRGSEFLLSLPLSKPVTIEVRAPAETTDRPLRIALVEDSADIREMTADLLTTLGHEVQAAEDGEKGLELILKQRPDVALVDMGLPGIDGCGVAAKVRALYDRQTIRLVAMTGYGLDSDRARARAAGFDDYLVKPADLDSLLRALSTRG
jgi:signal transduction histidine kinase